MVMSAEKRIEARTRLAEYTREGQGGLRRAVGSAGLMLANAWDRATSPFTNDRTRFVAASAKGATEFGLWGSIGGALLGMVILGAGASLVGFIGAGAGLGAVGGAIFRGQTAMEKHWADRSKPIGDVIAEKTGAVPQPKQYKGPVGKTTEERLKNMGYDPKLLEKADEMLKDDPSFLEREKRRREGRGPTVLNP